MSVEKDKIFQLVNQIDTLEYDIKELNAVVETKKIEKTKNEEELQVLDTKRREEKIELIGEQEGIFFVGIERFIPIDVAVFQTPNGLIHISKDQLEMRIHYLAWQDKDTMEEITALNELRWRRRC